MSLALVRSVADEDKQSGDVVTMAFHNGMLYTGAEGGKLVVYKPDLTVYKVVQAQFNTINAICMFNGDLITTGNDGLIKVWDGVTLELKKTLEGHENEVRVLLAKEGHLFSGDMNGKVKIWSTELQLLFTLSCVEEVWAADVASNIIYTTRTTDVTCTEVGFKESQVPGETRFVIVGSFPGRGPVRIAGDRLVFAAQDNFGLHVKETKSGHADVTTMEGHTKIVNALECVDNRLYSAGFDGLVKVWDATSFKLLATGTTVNNPVFSLAIGDGGAVYAGLAGGNIVQMVLQ